MALAVSEWTPQASLPVVRLRVPSAIISPSSNTKASAWCLTVKHTDMRDGGRGPRTCSVYLLYNLLYVFTEGTATSVQQSSEHGAI